MQADSPLADLQFFTEVFCRRINVQRAQEIKDLEAELEARYKAEKAKAISELDGRLERRRGESRANIEELLWRAQGCDTAGGEQQATQLQVRTANSHVHHPHKW